MPQIAVKQDIKKDAWNWWDACNKVSYEEDWCQRINCQLRNKIVNKSKKQVFSFLMPYLKDLYRREKINQKLVSIQKVFDKKQQEIFNRMEKVTGKTIYRKDFTCYLTTFPRAAYDYECGYVWLPIIWPKQTYIRTFIHELLHFQTYAYYEKQCLKKLTKKEFENLKEALTVILNEEFLNLIIWQDKGYKSHEHLREKLLKFWKKNKDFNKLVDCGIKICQLYVKGEIREMRIFKKTTSKGIIKRRNRILFVKDPKGVWELPGGKIDFGETPQEALKREFREELGWKNVRIGNHVNTWVFFSVKKEIKTLYTVLVFECFSKARKIKKCDECAEYKWIPAREIDEFEMRDGYKDSIKKYLKGDVSISIPFSKSS